MTNGDDFLVPSNEIAVRPSASQIDDPAAAARCRLHPYIFGVGLNRTGSTSVMSALKTLGYRVHDGLRGIRSAAVRYVKYGDDRILHDFANLRCRAWTDWPVHAYRDLQRIYPGSFWVLTVRDPADWVPSYRWLIARWRYRIKKRGWSNMMEHELVVQKQLFGRAWPGDDELRAGFERHNREVETFLREKRERLLVFDVCGGDGWGKLCGFLGKPVPDKPFPWRNRRPEPGSEAPLQPIWNGRKND